MTSASIIWDALGGVAAYAWAMWPLWLPVLVALTGSLVLRASTGRHHGGRGSARNERWTGPIFGLIWLAGVLIFMT